MGLFDNFLGVTGANPQYQIQGYGGFPMSPAAMPNYAIQNGPDNTGYAPRSPMRLVQQTPQQTDTGGGQDSTSPQRPQIFSPAEKQASGYNEYTKPYPYADTSNPNALATPLPRPRPDGAPQQPTDTAAQPQVSPDGRVVNGVYDDRGESANFNPAAEGNTIVGSLPPGDANGPFQRQAQAPGQVPGQVLNYAQGGNPQGASPVRSAAIPAPPAYANPGAPTSVVRTALPPHADPTYAGTPVPYLAAVRQFEGYSRPSPSSNGGTGTAADLSHFHPVFADRLGSAIRDAEAATGAKAQIESGFRPYEQQAEIYERSGHGTKFAAAPPGQSRHQYGAAADIAPGPVRDWIRQHASDYGLETLPDRLHDFGHIQIASRDYARGFDPRTQGGVGLAGQSGGWNEAQFAQRWNTSAQAVDNFKPGLPEGVRAALSDLTMSSGKGWMQSPLGRAVTQGDYFTAKNLMVAGATPQTLARRQQTARWMNSAIIGQKYANGAVAGFWKQLGGT